MFNSIRSRIFIACFALSLATAGIGIYGVVRINSSGALVESLFNQPLQAINFAREAGFVFAQMNSELLRERLGKAAVVPGQPTLDDQARVVIEDLDVAKDRSLTKQAASAAEETLGYIRRWDALRQQSATGGPTDALAGSMDALADQIIKSFDTLTERIVDDGFVEREKAHREIYVYEWTSGAAAILAFLFSLIITFVLARRILRPLSAAASVANRIAQGELETAIPPGGMDETGALLRSMTVMQASIREMMEREAAQRLSAQNRLIDAVEGSREGMMLVDSGDRLLIANSQVATFFPSIATMLVPGAQIASAFAMAEEKPDEISKPKQWLTRLFSDGEVKLAGGRWLRASRSATQEGGWFLFLSDITSLKEREESLEAARKAAEAASIAKSNFLANMGHELRTPLNAVIGFSEIIAGEQFGPVGNEQYREYAGDIMSSGRHLLAIINDVLDLAKSADGKLHLEADRVDLGHLLQDCDRLFGEQCMEAGLTFNITPAEGPQQVWGDEAKLRQILINLLSNAIKFSQRGGTVTLATRLAPQDMVELIVSDTGIGMREDEIKTALEPFGQVDAQLARRYEGVGLGLPLTKALVELHGGRLEIDSTPGEGTAVHVILSRLRPEKLRIVPPAARVA